MTRLTAVLTHPFTKGTAGAIVGGLLLLLALHVYTDHKALHQIVDMINANAARQQAAQK